jgi:hypothetical protein
MEQQAQRIRLKLPEQDLQFLTTGSDQPRKLKAWVDDLPLMNMGETSRQLYQFIQELNRLQLDSRQRFQLLEIVRPVILHVCDALGKHYLNRSVVLPDKARRVASLAQSLQGHLAGGYKLVTVRGMRKIREREARENVTVATHRAVSALTDTLMRCYQLYFPTPRNLWLELHQLYLLAEQNGFAFDEVQDDQFSVIESSTIADAYARALLLATAQPNQLRQQELATLYQATEEWSGLIDIKEAGGEADLFVFDLQQDRPPTYRTHASAAGGDSRYIDSAQLVERLSRARAGEKTDLHLPRGMNDALLSHLEHAWGALTERSFKRVNETGPIEICLGLGALHYYTSGQVSFESQVSSGSLQVLADEEENPFLSQRQKHGSARSIHDEEDPWSQAVDSGIHRMGDDVKTDNIDLSRQGVEGAFRCLYLPEGEYQSGWLLPGLDGRGRAHAIALRGIDRPARAHFSGMGHWRDSVGQADAQTWCAPGRGIARPARHPGGRPGVEKDGGRHGFHARSDSAGIAGDRAAVDPADAGGGLSDRGQGLAGGIRRRQPGGPAPQSEQHGQFRSVRVPATPGDGRARSGTRERLRGRGL